MDKHPSALTIDAEARAGLTRLRVCGMFITALGAEFGSSLAIDVAAARCRQKSARCDRGNQ